MQYQTGKALTMRINWFSNAPTANTGYGVQTRLFTPRIRDLGHDVSITAFFGYESGIHNFEGMRVYPKHRDPYGRDVLDAHAQHAKADIVISLIDAWVMSKPQTPWYPWFPIDSEPMPPPVLDKVSKATKPITMSKYGSRQAQNAGLEAYYVPHGVDTKVYKPRDMKESRKALGLPEDAFLVGMVAANKGVPPRKAFPQNIIAFAALKKQHPDAVLYLHTDDGTRGGDVVNLVEYCLSVGLQPGKDVWFPDQYANMVGLPDEYMVTAYSAMDVHMLVSMGEGFGVPLIEAQACGTPVIVGDWTAMSELCLSGWKVDKSEAMPFYQSYMYAYQYLPQPEAIADRLLAAYEMRGNQDYRKRAREGAMAYDADKVTEKYWRPVLEDIEKNLKGEEYPVTKVEL